MVRYRVQAPSAFLDKACKLLQRVYNEMSFTGAWIIDQKDESAAGRRWFSHFLKSTKRSLDIADGKRDSLYHIDPRRYRRRRRRHILIPTQILVGVATDMQISGDYRSKEAASGSVVITANQISGITNFSFCNFPRFFHYPNLVYLLVLVFILSYSIRFEGMFGYCYSSSHIEMCI